MKIWYDTQRKEKKKTLFAEDKGERRSRCLEIAMSFYPQKERETS